MILPSHPSNQDGQKRNEPVIQADLFLSKSNYILMENAKIIISIAEEKSYLFNILACAIVGPCIPFKCGFFGR